MQKIGLCEYAITKYVNDMPVNAYSKHNRCSVLCIDENGYGF